MKTFKIRASRASDIVSDSAGITEKQLATIDELKSKLKLTDKQSETLKELEAKRDAPPQLSEGAKTYCKLWLKEQLYDKKKEFSNKYTRKGWQMEDNAIDFISEQLGYGFLAKNEQHFEDDFMHGTPDVILADHVIDVKNSWDFSTFPLFEKECYNKNYYYQAQCYMHLTGRKNYKLIYVLMDTPEKMIEKEAYYFCNNNGYDGLDIDVYNSFVKNMTYRDIPSNLRIKVFNIEYNENDIIKLQTSVKLCRVYIQNLLNLVQ